MDVEIPRRDHDSGALGIGDDSAGTRLRGWILGLCRRWSGEQDLGLFRRLRSLLRESDAGTHGQKSGNKKLHEPRPFCGFAFAAAATTAAARRWRAASNSTTAPAAATFSESTRPAMGMRSRWSQVRRTKS